MIASIVTPAKTMPPIVKGFIDPNTLDPAGAALEDALEDGFPARMAGGICADGVVPVGADGIVELSVGGATWGAARESIGGAAAGTGEGGVLSLSNS